MTTIATHVITTARRAANRTKLALFALLVAALLWLPACNRGEIYYRYHHIPHAKWNRDDAVVFGIDSLASVSGQVYDVSLEITGSNQYPYRDLWLCVTHNFTDTVFRTDTVRINIADMHGKPRGNGVGGLYQLSVPYLSLSFPDSVYPHTLSVRHAMRDNPLTGIEKVGLIIQQKQ